MRDFTGDYIFDCSFDVFLPLWSELFHIVITTMAAMLGCRHICSIDILIVVPEGEGGHRGNFRYGQFATE